MRRILTQREAAEILGMTPRMLAARRRAGKIGWFKDGKWIGFTPQHVEEYIKACSKTPDKDDLEVDRLLSVLRRKLKPSP